MEIRNKQIAAIFCLGWTSSQVLCCFFFGWKSIAKYVKYAKQVLESIKKREFGQLKRIFPETQKTVTLFRCFHNPLMASG